MTAQGSNAASLSQQIVTYISYPFAPCLPSTSSSQYERQGLLSEASYDDSDAISLLSNIRDRSRRRTRASRRREEWSKRAATVGCGLFGRPKGQIARREVTVGDRMRPQHQRSASDDSAINRTSDDEGGPALSASGSFGGAQESGDEDAGMLQDEAIAEISLSRDEDIMQQDVPTVQVSAADDDEGKREAVASAELKAKLERDAEAYAKEQTEDAARLAADEAALAAEEEAAIAKAKRRAERRAAKEGLNKVRSNSQRERRRTEAEAEAAAGGFDFTQEVQQYSPRDYDYRQDEDPPRYGMPRNHEDDDQHEIKDYYPSELQQPEVVHHHHYYHEPQPEEEEVYNDSLLSPNFRVQEAPSFPSAKEPQETTLEEDEDDADIAGITFSKNKKSRPRGREGGSQTHSNGRSNGSGSGSRQSGSGQGQTRYEAHRRASDNSGEGGSGSGAGGGSSSGKRSYRDRPRRHESSGSKSTGSGSGLREGVQSRAMARSPALAETEDRAEAAAGGFEDFVTPSNAITDEQDLTGYRARERHSFGEQGSTGSSGQRRERRREGPKKAASGGLNQPRNPMGANVLVRGREEADAF